MFSPKRRKSPSRRSSSSSRRSSNSTRSTARTRNINNALAAYLRSTAYVGGGDNLIRYRTRAGNNNYRRR